MRYLGLAAFLVTVTCAHAPERVAAPELAHGERTAELDALLAHAYGNSTLSPSELDMAMAHAPHAAGAHEVAGYTALLRGDTRGVWQHFLTAAMDEDAPFGDLY